MWSVTEKAWVLNAIRCPSQKATYRDVLITALPKDTSGSQIHSDFPYQGWYVAGWWTLTDTSSNVDSVARWSSLVRRLARINSQDRSKADAVTGALWFVCRFVCIILPISEWTNKGAGKLNYGMETKNGLNGVSSSHVILTRLTLLIQIQPVRYHVNSKLLSHPKEKERKKLRIPLVGNSGSL